MWRAARLARRARNDEKAPKRRLGLPTATAAHLVPRLPRRRRRPAPAYAGLLTVAALVASLAFAPTALAKATFKYEAALSEKLPSTLTATVPTGFTKPVGVAFDEGGELFVGGQVPEAGSGVVDRFDPTGSFAAQLGVGSLRQERVEGVAVSDESGHVYVAESVPAQLTVLDASGAELSVWEGLNTPAETFAGGEGRNDLYSAVDNSSSVSGGDVYVMTLHEGGEVDVFKPQNGDKEEGEYLRQLTSPEGFSFEAEDGLAVDDSSGAEAGEVYVADTGHKVVDRFSATGEFEEAHQLKGFHEPIAVAVDSTNGEVFAVDRLAEHSYVVDAFGASGEPLGQITNVNGTPFGEPLSLGVSPGGEAAGDVYIADAETNRVDVFAEAKPGAPTVVEPSATEVSGEGADLRAQISSQGLPSDYHVEYGPCTTMFTCATSPYTSSAPSPEAAVGANEDYDVHEVSLRVKGLATGTTYHFRAVARNGEGKTVGQEGTFTTQGPSGELSLPDGRQWELVSPPDKYSGRIEPIGYLGVVEAADDGDAISYLANAPTEANPEGAAGPSQLLSQRAAGGWSSKDLATPHRAATGTPITGGSDYRFFAGNLESALLNPFGRFEPRLAEGEASEQTPYLRTLGSCTSACFDPLVSGAPGNEDVPPGTHFGVEALCEEENGLSKVVNPVCGPQALAATDDLSHVVLGSAAPLVEGAPGEVSPEGQPLSSKPRGSLYEWSAGALQLVSVLPANGAHEELPAPPAELAGADFFEAIPRRGLSADGSRVFWHSGEALYVRDTTLHRTLQLDQADAGCGSCESGGGHFQIASADGSRVVFSDQKRLSSDSGAGLEKPPGEFSETADLYECQIEERGGQLACGEKGPVDITPQVAGKSANVQGAVLGSGEDGEDLYFVALGTLGTGSTARGQSAVGGQPNLFVRVRGVTRFIAPLASGDQDDWTGVVSSQPTRVSPNGQWLSFMSEAPLTSYDNHDAVSGKLDAEVYLYDASANQLECASCDPTGARPVGVEYGNLISAKSESTLIGAKVLNEWSASGWVAALAPLTTEFLQERSAYQARYLNDEGRLFFNSLDALAPGDVNGNWDVYEHEPAGLGGCGAGTGGYQASSESCLGLISSGTSAQQSAFMDASESGDDAFFITTSKLSSADIDNSYDVYDAHVCSGASPCIAAPAAPGSPCVSEASCKPAANPQPPIFGAPASVTFQGPGNPAPTPSKPKPKTAAQIKAEKLKKALKSCRAKKNKQKRAACEKSARKKYGAKAKKAKAKGKK